MSFPADGEPDGREDSLRMSGDAAHWRGAYARTDPDRLSWHESEPRRSLELIESAQLPPKAAILDLGGGTSSLAARLVDAGYTDVTVADISAAALERARADCGSLAARITWLEADVRVHRFARRYDLWHDRAVFHFMVAPADREAYLEALRRTLRPGGHLVIATFGPEGPERCSGLPVARYDAAGLAAALGAEFAPVSSGLGLHRTPSGTAQQFLYAHFARRTGPAADDGRGRVRSRTRRP